MKKILWMTMAALVVAVAAQAARADDEIPAGTTVAAVPTVTPVVVETSDDKPSPRPPYLAPVPDYGKWTVTFKFEPAEPDPAAAGTDADGAAQTPKAPAPPDGFPSVIETVKAGDLRSVALTFVKGAPKRFICQGDYVLFPTPRGPQIMVVDPSHRPYMYYSTGFAMLEGTVIGAATYQGVEDYNGAQAFHYKNADTDVWIDIATMLPLGVKKGIVEAVYQFIPTPKKPVVTIPPDQAALLEKGIEADKYVRSLR